MCCEIGAILSSIQVSTPVATGLHSTPMLILYIKDYPQRIGEIIQRELECEYTLTGSYPDGELVWELRYMGMRDTRILELTISEYILSRGE